MGIVGVAAMDSWCESKVVSRRASDTCRQRQNFQRTLKLARTQRRRRPRPCGNDASRARRAPFGRSRARATRMRRPAERKGTRSRRSTSADSMPEDLDGGSCRDRRRAAAFPSRAATEAKLPNRLQRSARHASTMRALGAADARARQHHRSDGRHENRRTYIYRKPTKRPSSCGAAAARAGRRQACSSQSRARARRTNQRAFSSARRRVRASRGGRMQRAPPARSAGANLSAEAP